jgi:hypothetical protein
MAYANIPDGTLAPESGMDYTVFRQLRDNAVSLHDDSRAFAAKAADETVNNSAAYQDDDDLTFAVKSGETWAVTLSLIFSTGTTPQLKVQMASPGGSTGRMMATSQYSSTQAIATLNVIGSGVRFQLGSAASQYAAIIDAYVTAGADGNVTVQWAQFTANASDTTVHAGSFLAAHRVSQIA